MVDVHYDQDLKLLNTFGLEASAKAFVMLQEEKELIDILALPEFDRQTVLWLGGGSNVLFMQDYPGLVVKMANRGIQIEDLSDHTVRVTAAAGEIWHDFVRYTLSEGLSGLENLSLIPGTVGASPVQNIGAYGVEVKDVIEKVRCWDLEAGEYIELDNSDCDFAYRDSVFKREGKGRYVITAVSFLLSCVFKPKVGYGDLQHVVEELSVNRIFDATLVSDAVCQIRSAKLPDPNQIGNVGSFYKNPIVPSEKVDQLLKDYPHMPHYPYQKQFKLAAGWLIDQCGLKGFSIGDAAVHDKQALVLINRGNATAKDLAALSKHIVNTVYARFGVLLEPEPNHLPECLSS